MYLDKFLFDALTTILILLETFQFSYNVIFPEKIICIIKVWTLEN